MNESLRGLDSAVLEQAGFLDDAVSEYSQDADYLAEAMALRFAEDAARLMQSQGISRAKLAGQMGVSRAYITRIFDAPPNLTLRSIAKLAIALGLTPEIHVCHPDHHDSTVVELAPEEP